MLRKGHRTVAFISSFQSDLAGQFESGLRTALESSGSSLPPDRVVYLETGEYSKLETYEQRVDCALTKLLAQEERPTALFATFDDLTEMAFLQLVRRGINVPSQMSLISFGGATRIGPMQQQLSAVTVDEVALGQHAASLLDDMRSGRKPIEHEDRVEISLGISEGITLAPVKS
jgi:DNA-binding LacI/PurR family transcriptional regulator